MRKLIILSIFCFTLIEAAHSQLLIAFLFGDKLNNPNTEFGLNVGGNISQMYGIQNTKFNHGFGIGLFFTWKMHDNWQLQPELFFRYPLGARQVPPYSISEPQIDSVLENTTIYRNMLYFSLPINLKYRVYKEFRISLAPQLSLLYNNEDVFYKKLDSGDEFYYRREEMDHLYRWDFGVSVGASYKLRKGTGVNLELRYYHGFLNTEKATNLGEATNAAICMYVGIPIKMGKKETEEATKD